MKIDRAALERMFRTCNPVALDHFSGEILKDSQRAAPRVTGALQNLDGSGDGLQVDKADEEDGIHYVGSALPYTTAVETGEKDGKMWRKAGPANFLRGALFVRRN